MNIKAEFKKYRLQLLLVLVLSFAFILVEPLFRHTSPLRETPQITSVPTDRPKVDLKKLFGNRAFASVDEIPSGEKVLALVDHDCLDKRTQSKLSESLIAISKMPRAPGLRQQAYRFQTQPGIKLADWNQLAGQDECLLRMEPDDRVQFRLDRPQVVSSRAVHATAVTGSAQASGALLETLSDPQVSSQLFLNNIKAFDAWNLFFSPTVGISESNPVVVAVIDSGIDYNHEDLVGKLWQDNAGKYGYDFENGDDDPMDDYFHGTFVSGLIAASANGRGGVGVALRYVRIMAVKVVDAEGSAAIASIANGIRYAVDRGANVINLSLGVDGGTTTYPAMLDAVNYAASRGAVITVAAGNSARQISASFRSEPAMYSTQVPAQLTVGAIDSAASTLSSFSNFSTTYVQLGAPGSNGIISTLPNNQYGTSTGTSFAAPIVAAAAALVIGTARTHGLALTNSDVTRMILESSFQNPALTSRFSQGRQLDLNALSKYLRDNYIVTNDAGVNSNP